MLLPFYLEESAKLWYQALPEVTQKDLELFKPEFEARFRQNKTFDVNVLQITQATEESIVGYITRLQVATRNHQLPASVVVAIAVNELKPNIHQWVINKEQATLEQVYGLLKKLMEGKWEGFEIWVDNWPEFQSVVMKPSGDKQMDPYTGKFYFVDSQDVASMTSLLDDPRVITWNDDINLFVSDPVWPLVEQRAKARGNILWVADAPIYTVSRDTLVDIKLPDGFQEVPLGSDAISHVNENWKYKMPGIDQYMHLLVERGYPTVCFRDPTGALAAYAATQFDNILGMLTVLPQFRGKKLGTAAMSLLARKNLVEDDVVGVLVEDNNAVSIHMHMKLGFKPVPCSKVHWSLYTSP